MKIDSEVYVSGFNEAIKDVEGLVQDRKSFTPSYYDELQKELYVLLDWNLNKSNIRVEWKLGYVDGMREEVVRLVKMIVKIG